MKQDYIMLEVGDTVRITKKFAEENATSWKKYIDRDGIVTTVIDRSKEKLGCNVIIDWKDGITCEFHCGYLEKVKIADTILKQLDNLEKKLKNEKV